MKTPVVHSALHFFLSTYYRRTIMCHITHRHNVIRRSMDHGIQLQDETRWLAILFRWWWCPDSGRVRSRSIGGHDTSLSTSSWWQWFRQCHLPLFCVPSAVVGALLWRAGLLCSNQHCRFFLRHIFGFFPSAHGNKYLLPQNDLWDTKDRHTVWAVLDLRFNSVMSSSLPPNTCHVEGWNLSSIPTATQHNIVNHIDSFFLNRDSFIRYHEHQDLNNGLVADR